jgi:hypothetical protein
VNNRALNTIVARCIVDAMFAAALFENDASALTVYQLNDKERSELTPALIQKIRSFAGFICKVQHNDLWDSFPFTRALLRLYRLEHEVFGEYAAYRQAMGAPPKSRAARRLAFIDFLISQLGEGRTAAYPGVIDAALHERILEEFRAAVHDNATALARTRVHDGDLCERVPQIRGLVRIGYFSTDPVAVTEALKLGRFDVDAVRYCNGWRCYWLEPDHREVRLVDVDPGVAMLLAMVDGRLTTDEVVAQASRALEITGTLAEWLAAVKRLVNIGMLTFHTERR